MTRVAVIGAGEAAVQIGCEFALGGCTVQLLGFDAAGVGGMVERSLRLAAARGTANPPELERARSLIAAGGEQADGRVALILEALDGSIERKAAAISSLAGPHPEALVATISEAISPTELGAAAGVGERMLAARWGEPPMLLDAVELLPARDTPARLVDRVAQLLRAIGKRPVTLRGETAGMISGSLELALLGACRRLIDEGVADAEQIDAVAAESLARTWAAIGPLGAAALRAPGALGRLAVAAGEDAAAADALERLGALRRERENELRSRRDLALGGVSDREPGAHSR